MNGKVLQIGLAQRVFPFIIPKITEQKLKSTRLWFGLTNNNLTNDTMRDFFIKTVSGKNYKKKKEVHNFRFSDWM